jgi:hypothetical protein
MLNILTLLLAASKLIDLKRQYSDKQHQQHQGLVRNANPQINILNLITYSFQYVIISVDLKCIIRNSIIWNSHKSFFLVLFSPYLLYQYVSLSSQWFFFSADFVITNCFFLPPFHLGFLIHMSHSLYFKENFNFKP